MTRIGVLSDTHGDLAAAQACVKVAGEVDMWLHLGDHVSDALHIREQIPAPIHMVRGNCDFRAQDAFAPYEMTLDIEGGKFLLTHGHALRVKHGLTALYHRAKAVGAICALYGHSHIAALHRREGILLLNPGSPAEPRDGAPSFLLLAVQGNGIFPEIDVEVRRI